jgi:hypothetical protein
LHGFLTKHESLMNADEFREIALSFPEAMEAGHFDHPDFRVGGKIFATLGWPDESWGVVKLTPDQQQEIIARDPDMFEPVKGGWGRRGATNVVLARAKSAAVHKVLGIAWSNVAPKRLRKAGNI